MHLNVWLTASPTVDFGLWGTVGWRIGAPVPLCTGAGTETALRDPSEPEPEPGPGVDPRAATSTDSARSNPTEASEVALPGTLFTARMVGQRR
jgi:hypothetical protein